jgi:hypothetical protein
MGRQDTYGSPMRGMAFIVPAHGTESPSHIPPIGGMGQSHMGRPMGMPMPSNIYDTI